MNVCVYVGEGLRRSFATPDPFILTNKICLNQYPFLSNIVYMICSHLLEYNADCLYFEQCGTKC